jgi:spore coat protein U-like protein
MKIIKATILVLGAFSSFALYAGTQTAQLPVTASVAAKCNAITPNTLAFGAVDPIATGNIDVATTMTFTCTKNTAYWIALDGGQSGNVTARYMLNTANTDQLTYSIYTNSTRTQNWGVTNGVDTYNVASSLPGLQTVNVYGRVVVPQLTASNGSYNDSVTITLNF